MRLDFLKRPMARNEPMMIAQNSHLVIVKKGGDLERLEREKGKRVEKEKEKEKEQEKGNLPGGKNENRIERRNESRPFLHKDTKQ